MRTLQRIWDDIRRGENIDLYATVCAAIGLVILNLIGIASTTWIAQITLAVLGLIAISTIGNRYRIEEVLKHLTSSAFGAPKVYLTPGEMGDDGKFIDDINKAKHRIDLQGLSLSYLATNHKVLAALQKRISAGVRVRIAIMSPDNPLIDGWLGFRQFKHPEVLRTQCRACADIFGEFQKRLGKITGKRGHFDFVLCKTSPISVSLRRFDDKMHVIHFIPNLNTSETPVYLIRETENRELFQTYVSAFEEQFDTLKKQIISQ